MLRSLALVGTVCLFLACQGEWFGPPDSPDSPADHLSVNCNGRWVWQEKNADGVYEDQFFVTIEGGAITSLTPVASGAQSLLGAQAAVEGDHERMLLTFSMPKAGTDHVTLRTFLFGDLSSSIGSGILEGLSSEEDVYPGSDDYPQLIPEHAGRLVLLSAGAASVAAKPPVSLPERKVAVDELGEGEGEGGCPRHPTVGPGQDYRTIQEGIDAVCNGCDVTVYRNTDHVSGCYDEHITIGKALTLQGASTTANAAACIGPSTGGDMVTITASNVTVKDLEISGRARDPGNYTKGNGGRAGGHGIWISGHDITDVLIDNCTVSYCKKNNIFFEGDGNNDGGGNVTISNCYILGSDTYELIKLNGGGGSTAHLIRNNLIKLGRTGVATDAYVKGLTIEKNIISGWPYWGHLAHEVRDGSHGGGSRYQSNCRLGILIWSNTTSPNPIFTITNNLIISTYNGIYMGNTRGVIRNNTIVNPFALQAGWENNGANIQSHTMGIGLVNGFGSGGVAETAAIENNAIIVTGDNRAAKATGGDGYTTGISGYGIAFAAVEYYGLIGYSHYVSSGSLMGTYSIQNNNVWGFFSKDGDASLGSGGTGSATNWGEGLTTCGSNGTANCVGNFSSDPKFATDSTPEAPDGHIDSAKVYELYEDNYFEASTAGSCHADVKSNTAGSTGFVDLTSSDDLAALGSCGGTWPAFPTTDTTTFSPDIDAGKSGSDYSGEPGVNGSLVNIGAFGNTSRASQSTGVLNLVGVDVGSGSVRDNTNNFSGLRVIQPRTTGIKEINLYFNQAPTISGTTYAQAFTLTDYCGTPLSAPTGWAVDTSSASVPPYKVKLSWTTGYTNQAVGVLIDSSRVTSDVYGSTQLDGEISDVDTSELPSGNGTAGGNAEFVVFSLVGDVNGDRKVDSSDLADISALDNSTASGLPEDVDGDGVVEGGSGEDDYVSANARTAAYWVASTADTNTSGTLRYALNNITDGSSGNLNTIRFDIGTFASCRSATIDVDSSALPTLDNNYVAITTADPVTQVVIDDTDGDLASGAHGLTISGSNNVIKGLAIQRFDASASTHGIYITGASNTIGGTGTGEPNTIISNGGSGIYVSGASAKNNFWPDNVIYGNTTAPITLASSANESVATPTLSCADTNTVQGTGAAANATIYIYTNDDGDNDCEVYKYSGTADAAGAFTIDNISPALTQGQYVTVIQTNSSNDSSAVATKVAIGAAGTCPATGLNFSGVTLTTIDSTNSVGQYTSITSLNSTLAVSYYNATNVKSLKLWYDDGAGGGTAGDGIATAGEIRTIDSSGTVVQYTSITSLGGYLAISYYDGILGTLDLKLWYDDGKGGGTAGDGIANGSEIRTIDSTGTVGQYTSITTLNSKLAISYYDATNGDLKLWYDDGAGGGTSKDGVANGSEIRTIDSAGTVGQYTSITSMGGYLAVAYYDSTNKDLKLWWDDGNNHGTAGDGVANGSEIRTIASVGDVGMYTSITSLSNYLAVSYYDNTNGDLKLWWDNGAGGGTAGDGVANGSEIRTIDSTGNVGKYTAIGSYNNDLIISYYDVTNGDLKVWYDDGSGGGTAGDGVATAGEIHTIDSTNDVGQYTAITTLGTNVYISYYYVTGLDLKLAKIPGS